MYYFAKASAQGYLGGFVVAAGVSFINVIIGFLAGYFALPSLYHKQPGRKALGIVGLLLLAIATLSVNLFVGHYRAALQQDAQSAHLAAIASWSRDPLAIETFEGWLLFAIGVLIAVLMTVKSFVFDDPYPGYGAISRSFDEANDAWTDAIRELQERIVGETDLHRKKLEQRLTAAERAVIAIEMTLNQLRSYPQLVSTLNHELRAAAKDLIARYRSVNIEIRSTPPPKSFSEPPAVDFDHVALDADFSNLVARLDNEKARLDEFKRTKVRDLYEVLADTSEAELRSLHIFLERFEIDQAGSRQPQSRTPTEVPRSEANP